MKDEKYNPEKPYFVPRLWLLEKIGPNPIVTMKDRRLARNVPGPRKIPIAYTWRECKCRATLIGVGDIWEIYPCEKHAEAARQEQEREKPI